MIKKFSTGLACCVFGLGSLASATILIPGTSGAAPSGFSSAGWTLLASTGVQALSSGSFTANATSWVYADTGNTFCSGCLDFVYQITRTGGSDSIERITAGSFTGFQTDVGFVTGSVGVTTTGLDRSSSGGVIGWAYAGASALTGSQGTRLLIVETDTKFFTTGVLSVQDGLTANGVAFQATSVPEPISMAMLGGGLAFLGMLRFRRK
jgi:hypothetical protein